MGRCLFPRRKNRLVSLPLVLFFFLDWLPTGTSFGTTWDQIPASGTQSTASPSTITAPQSRLFLAQDQLAASGNVPGPVFTNLLVSKSGLPVCKYALGGAARSTQPTSLVHDYCEIVRRWFKNDEKAKMAPFLFYYNPHRYPDFMEGIRQVAEGNNNNSELLREDLFLVSGGTDRSEHGMEQRLSDALAYSGGNYLDMFILEYVCPYEAKDDPDEFMSALAKAHSWVEKGKVRYVAASTHSHRVGAWLGSLLSEPSIQNDRNTRIPLLDAMMLRYNMAHRSAAEQISFPVCSEAGIPVLAFTTTRWNRLQAGHPSWSNDNGDEDDDENDKTPKRLPTTPECLSFALSPSRNPPVSWPVEVALHSARTSDELKEAMGCLTTPSQMTETEEIEWKNYGDLEWNDLDGFDEYPEEQTK